VVSDVAKLLGVTPQAIEKKIERGELTALHSSPRRVPRTEVTKAVRRRRLDLVTDLTVLELEMRRFGVTAEDPPVERQPDPSLGRDEDRYAQAVLERLGLLETENRALRSQLETERTGRAVAEARIDDLTAKLHRTRQALHAFEVERDPRTGL
jgi:hypothetical protein